MLKRILSFSVLCFAAIALAGCSEQIEKGLVSGQVVSAEGEPLNQVRVYFMPDYKKETKGRASWAVTDDEGKFNLEYQNGTGGLGAAIGWHKVTLKDIAGENHRGPGRPPAVRIPATYMDPVASPLSFEVVPGDQTIDLKLEPTKRKRR